MKQKIKSITAASLMLLGVCLVSNARSSMVQSEFWAGTAIAAMYSDTSEEGQLALIGMAAVHGSTWAIIGSAVSLGPAGAVIGVGFAL